MAAVSALLGGRNARGSTAFLAIRCSCGWNAACIAIRVVCPSRVENVMAKTPSYSAKAASAGKDIGKPGKQFGTIASKAAKEYGSAAAGKRVAGAVLAKLRGK